MVLLLRDIIKGRYGSTPERYHYRALWFSSCEIALQGAMVLLLRDSITGRYGSLPER